jgi:hypothetical protein
MATKHANVQNVGMAKRGSGVTRGGRPLNGPENQRVSKQSPKPSPVGMPGQKKGSAPQQRRGPISR